MPPSKKIAVTDLSFNQKIQAKYRMGRRNLFSLPVMIFSKNAEPFFLKQRLIQGWLSLFLHANHFFFLLWKSIPANRGLSLGDPVARITPGSFLGRGSPPLEKLLFWIRREIKSEDPFDLSWLKRIESVLSSQWATSPIPSRRQSPRSPFSSEPFRSSSLRTILRHPLMGKGLDARTAPGSRTDPMISSQLEKDEGSHFDPLPEKGWPGNRGLYRKTFRPLPKGEPLYPGIPIPAITVALPSSLIGNRVPLKTDYDSRTDRGMRSKPPSRSSWLPDPFLIEALPSKWGHEKHLFPFTLRESLSRTQIHIPSHGKIPAADMASFNRRTGYGVEEQGYFFRKESLAQEIESLKKSVAMTQKVLEERERLPYPSNEPDLKGPINIHHLADQVYRSIERRITVDRERRGIY